MAQCPGRTIGTATLTTQPADCCRGGPWLSLFICQPAGAGPSTRSSWSRAGGAAIPPCQALATAPLPTSRIWIPSGPGLTPWLAPLWLTDHRNGWGSSAGGGGSSGSWTCKHRGFLSCLPELGQSETTQGSGGGGHQGAHVTCGLNPTWMQKGNAGHQASHHEGL